MQSPPPYSASGRKKSNVGLIIAIVVGCLALCCVLPVVLIGKIGMDTFNSSKSMLVCATNMAALRDGISTYAKKNKGVLPDAVNWRKDIEPYLKAPVIPSPFKSGDFKNGICDESAATVITYNSDVAGKKSADLEEKEDTIVLFESPGTGNSASKAYTVQSLEQSPKIIGNKPRGWVQIGTSGDAFVIGKNGQRANLGKISQNSSGSVKINSGN